MVEPARLHVVSGEVPSDPLEALRAQVEVEREQRRMLERDLRGKRLQVANLEAQLRDKAEADPGAPVVQAVLEYFSRRAVETGWWSQAPRFEVGDERWKAVAARLKKNSVAECFVAIEGAFQEDKHRTKRAFVDVAWVFAKNRSFEQAFEHRVDPDLRRVGRHLREVPDRLLARWPQVEELEDVCECTHLRFDHDRPRPLEGVFDPPCAVHGCACTAFWEPDPT